MWWHTITDYAANYNHYSQNPKLAQPTSNSPPVSQLEALDDFAMGPTDSGKGTQSSFMKDEYCLCHLVTATGDLLRARETSSVSRKDEEAIEKLQEMLQRQGTKLDKVLNFAADEAILEERITGRRIHPPSGTIYHSKFAPPKCMAALMMVQDELESLLTVYDSHSFWLLHVYEKLVEFRFFFFPASLDWIKVGNANNSPRMAPSTTPPDTTLSKKLLRDGVSPFPAASGITVKAINAAAVIAVTAFSLIEASPLTLDCDFELTITVFNDFFTCDSGLKNA
ncbi:unnamed protein product [Fraxinus pennsylvanica]|uniref:Adenylate kinase n=1 Tax=Fraxinus pennsylvanica TaxID=56036 RepID=A0AAD1YYQ0_9LAMI|nr:unnamed protein product [Fraxinus pennsylvanica]